VNSDTDMFNGGLVAQAVNTYDFPED